MSRCARTTFTPLNRGLSPRPLKSGALCRRKLQGQISASLGLPLSLPPIQPPLEFDLPAASTSHYDLKISAKENVLRFSAGKMDYDPMVMDDAEALGPVVKISQVRLGRDGGGRLICGGCVGIRLI